MERIAILVWALYGGGAERVAGLLSKKLENEYETYVVVLYDDNIVYEYGGKLISLTKKSKEWGMRLDSALKRLKGELHISVSISFLEGMNILNICARNNDAIIISERCTQSKTDPPNPYVDMLIEKYYEHADYVVACSYGVKYDLEHNYGINGHGIGVVYNFIDKERIRELENKVFDRDIDNFLCGSEYYISIGRLNRQKNQEYLIRQFAEFVMSSGYDDKKLMILGSGEEYERLNNLINTLDAEDNIRLFEYKTNPFNYIKKAKALIVASRYEGLPNVILEAMTVGTPVISSDCFSGPRELLLGNTDYSGKYQEMVIGERGIIIPEEEGTEKGWLKQALILFESNDSIAGQISANAYKYMESYSASDIKDEWIRVIRNVRAGESEDLMESEYLKLDKANNIYIYGAGEKGSILFDRLSPDYNIESFIVTKDSIDQKNGVPVKRINEVALSENDAVVIGVGGKYVSEVYNILEEKDCTTVYFPF